MQVDDKLAKEKLIRKLYEAAKIYRGVSPKLNPYAVIRAEECETWATAIRNTDLTDCQPQGYFETNCSGPKCVATTTGCQRGHCQLKNFKNGHMTIAPAPDQGSVRNATDRQQCLAKIDEWHDWAKRIAKSDTHDARSKDVAIIEMNVLFHLAEEIRALPDQKD